MICSASVDFSPDQIEHPHAPLPLDHAQYVMKLNEISERARERGEQRRLRRLAAHKTQANVSNPCEIESPGTVRTPKPYPQLYTPTAVPNQSDPPSEITRKPSNQLRPDRSCQLNPHPPLVTPVSLYQTPATYGPRIPYSESRGELQRQFVVRQRLQHEGYIEPRELAEVEDTSFGRFTQFSNADLYAPSPRPRAEKLPWRVSYNRVERMCRGSVANLGGPKKVRFAPVVECLEY